MRAATTAEISPFSWAALKIRDPYDIHLEPYKSDQLTIKTGNFVP
jgi:hypothetical protein